MSEVARAVGWDDTPDGLDSVAADLRAMRRAAGEPSFATIGRRVARLRAERGVPDHERRVPRSTLYDYFRDGRRRLDLETAGEVAAALGLPAHLRSRWAARVQAAQAAADGAAIAVARARPPAPVPYFTGRRSQLDALARALTATPPRRVWISGMPGAGKTQLALVLAQRLAADDVRSVYLDLRGRDAESPPVGPVAAQRALLRELGAAEVADGELTGALAAALRASGRLLLLDDAADPAHVTRILGEAPVGAAVIVTSRARPPVDWTHLGLGGLEPDEAAQVLRSFATPGDVDPSASARLIEVCGGLPLAVTLVGGRLASHPGWTLAEHVDLMAERVATGNLDDELRTTLELSYAGLSRDAARLLRLFADLPVAEIGDGGAAAVLDTDRACARRLLEELLDSGMVVRRSPARVGLHSLVRSFARARAQETDSPRARHAAFGRVARHGAEQTWRAYAAIARSMDDEPRRTSFEYPTDPWSVTDARAWLEDRLGALLALAHAAPERGHPDLLFRISEGLSWWMNVAGHHGQAIRLHEAAADLAARLGDHDALAAASLDAGQLLTHRERPDEALAHFDRATLLIEDADALADGGMVGILHNMAALVELRRGNTREATRKLRRAVEVHERLGESTRLMAALVNLGLALHTTGRFEEEAEVLERGLALAQAKGHRIFLANFLVNRSHLRLETGDGAAALRDAEDAVATATEVGFSYLVVSGEGAAAEALHRLGDLDGAQACIERALAGARELGSGITTAEQLLVAAGLAADRAETARAVALLEEAEGLLTADSDHVLRGRIWQLRGELEPDGGWSERARGQFVAAGAHQARRPEPSTPR